ncbi:fatty acyl-CoA hydrolase precursor, medium chain-like [Schistocerca serialis cubense]|uniref:fatty acyl-CoA hydrolase precursor, medium chain-like n=1 Tax=Schistocerca serialis cubense TaxID=2023355 RepID=UPI00214EE61A|nr:fatty acyl-CoA hydrolase precursor, medium chain-like [Schistocerca serialis cubense]
MWCAAYVVAIGLVLCTAQEADYATVRVSGGLVRGYRTTSVRGTPYWNFQGLPYAAPPVGPLRFALMERGGQAGQGPELDVLGGVICRWQHTLTLTDWRTLFSEPQPAASWDDVRNATEEAPQCLQVGDAGDVVGDEDCLYLNVYTPELNADIPRTVMVWIHGGGFVGGSPSKSEYGPDFFMDRDVVVTSISYRLGTLGFLSLEDEVLPGNLGLKDQTAALRWLRDNVAAFGGDPNAITLFGHSAGSASVALHVLSPLSAGLFSRAIAQSGPPVGSVTLTTGARDKAFRLARLLGYQGNDSQQFLDLLRAADAKDLVDVDDRILTEEEKMRYIQFAFVPIVEPALAGAFLPEPPQTLAREGRFNQVPFITGVTTADGNMLLPMLEDPQWLETLNTNLSAVLSGDFRDVDTPEEQQDLAAKVKDFYFGAGNNITDTPEGLLNASMMFTDIKFAEPTDSTLHLMANASSQTFYYYQFAYRGPNTPLPQYPGVAHGAEVQLEFMRENSTADLDPDSEDGRVRDRWVNMLTDFAKYGDPMANTSGVWQPFTRTSSYYLIVNTTDSLGQNKDEQRMQFWRQNMPL